MVKLCDICGSLGNADIMVACSQCNTKRHAYCMWIVPEKVPDIWSCEECSPSTNVGSPNCISVVLPSKPQRPRNGKSNKIKLLSTEEAIKMQSGTNRVESSLRKTLNHSPSSNRTTHIPNIPPGVKTVGLDSLYSRTEPRRTYQPLEARAPSEQFRLPPSHQTSKVPKVKTSVDRRLVTSRREQPKVIPRFANAPKTCDLKVNRTSHASSRSMHDLQVNNSGGNTRANAGIRRSTIEEKKTSGANICADALIRKSAAEEKKCRNADAGVSKSIVEERKAPSGNACADADINKSIVKEKKTPSSQQTQPNNSPNLPRIQPHWKGSFEIVTSATSKLYDGFTARPPPKIHPKALKFSRDMPSKLRFKLLPRCTIWGGIFQDECPDEEDIGLYITPQDSNNERSMQHYNYLLEAMELHDSVMCCSMDVGVEFLIFTSRLLDNNLQGFYPRSFLWGLFRHVTKRIIVDPWLTYDHHHHAEDTEVGGMDMEIDMIGGVDV